MTDCKLKIGLDYHGVIDQRSEYFSEFCKIARQRGHRIYIITGGPQAKVEEYLRHSNIEYDVIFAILDYYKQRGEAVADVSGELIVPEDLWNRAKADFCRSNHINFHIDNGREYQCWFTTPFCLYDEADGICKLSSNITIDLNENPEKVIARLEEIVRTDNN